MTPERLQELREGGESCPEYMGGVSECVAEIERLQVVVNNMSPALIEAKRQRDEALHSRNQHRETLQWVRDYLSVLEGKVTGVAGLLDELQAERETWLLDTEETEGDGK
jgi:hypothetical protein